MDSYLFPRPLHSVSYDDSPTFRKTGEKLATNLAVSDDFQPTSAIWAFSPPVFVRLGKPGIRHHLCEMLGHLFTSGQERGDTRTRLRRLCDTLPILAPLCAADRDALAELATDFLQRKTLEGAGGLDVNPPMQDLLALQACLPILRLGLALYNGWHSVILYPDEFRTPYQFYDPAGVVHEGSRDLSGEAWHRGPVVLAWSHVQADALAPEPDGNVVIHEMAHKLDMLNGDVNGMPPLHRGMNPLHWSQAMSTAYEDLNRHLDADQEPPIDSYAAQSPGEFFAVVTELFFAWPDLLANAYPDVYHQCRLYFRQDLLVAPTIRGTQ